MLILMAVNSISSRLVIANLFGIDGGIDDKVKKI